MNGRREFLKQGLAASIVASTSLLAQGEDTIDPDVLAEMSGRLKYLTPPQGTPPTIDVAPSPPVKPFQTPFFRPCIAEPLFALLPEEYPLRFAVEASGSSSPKALSPVQLSKVDIDRVTSRLTGLQLRQTAELDLAWLAAFWKRFAETAELLSSIDVDLGDLPDPFAHQRFFDFKPQYFYTLWEVEFSWRFHDQYGDDSYNWGFATFCDHGDAKEERGNHGSYSECTFAPLQRTAHWTRPSTGKLKAQQLHLEASSPGPTFRVRYEEPVLVRRINALPEILNDSATYPTRRRIKFALPSTTTHLHNAHTASESDGHPNDWINPGEYWDHHYGNFPSGYDPREKLTTLWYHDHRMDFTAANVYAGLDGFYTLHDELRDEDGRPIDDKFLQDVGDEEKGWGLPSGDYDVPMIFHDLMFGQVSEGKLDADEWKKFAKGEKRYDESPQLIFDGFNTDGILGDRLTVNRIIQPVMHVEPRKYRFRLLNGGPSRFYELTLNTETLPTPRAQGAAPADDCDLNGEVPFIIIAGDGNVQPDPLLARSLYMGVAQRIDIVIDFSEFQGRSLFLVNLIDQPNGRGPSGRVFERETYNKEHASQEIDEIEPFLRDLGMVKFVVDKPLAAPDKSTFPLVMRSFPPVDLTEVRRERLWEFDFDGGLWTVNGMTFDPNRIDAGIEQDTAEIWTLRNLGNSWSHPIHSHFTEFIILEINGVPQYQYTVQESDAQDQRKYFAPNRTFLPIESDELLRNLQKAHDAWEKSGKAMLQERTQGNLSETMKAMSADVTKEWNECQWEWWLQQRLKFTEGKNQRDDLTYRVVFQMVTQLASGKLRATLRDFVDANISLEEVRLHSAKEFRVLVVLLRILNIAWLDLRNNEDTVKGDGRFMGGPRRDVALLLPDWEVTVFMRWKDFLGKHVMHCHNVVHEDHAMMIRWDIVPPGHGFDTPKRADRFYAQEMEKIPHVQPEPGHAQKHENDSDGNLRR